MDRGRRAAWFESEFADHGASTPRKRRRKTKKNALSETTMVDYDNGDHWTASFGPTSVDQLVVQSRKIGELRSAIEQILQEGEPKVLVVHGPPGCGKTLTLRLLCQQMDVEMVEWTETGSSDWKEANLDSIWEPPVVSCRTQSDDFMDFLLRGTKYPSIVALGQQQTRLGSPPLRSRRLVVIKNLPLTTSLLANKMKAVIWKVLEKNVFNPMVFIFTDAHSTAQSSSWRSLFDHPASQYVGPLLEVSFNPITAAATTKTLKKILNQLPPSYCTRRVDVKLIVDACQGDIQSAINNLQFIVQQYTRQLPDGTRDLHPGLFRTLGRFMHGKVRDKLLNNKPGCPPGDDQPFAVEEAIEHSGCSESVLSSYLFENYIDYRSNINDIKEIAHLFSIGDLLNKWQIHEDTGHYAAILQGLALSVHHEVPARCGFRSFRKSRDEQTARATRMTMERYLDLHQALDQTRVDIADVILDSTTLMWRIRFPTIPVNNGMRPEVAQRMIADLADTLRLDMAVRDSQEDVDIEEYDEDDDDED